MGQAGNLVHNSNPALGFVTFTRDAQNRPVSVVSSDNVTLLHFDYSVVNKTTLTDAYNRKIVMHFGIQVPGLTTLLDTSLIGDATLGDPLMRWQYAYTGFSANTLALLTAVSAPNPSGNMMGVTQNIPYDTNLHLAQVTDAEGRPVNYATSAGGTSLSIPAVDANTPGLAWTQLLNGTGTTLMLDAGAQDANAAQTTLTRDPTETYEPGVMTNPLNQQVTLSYETPPAAQPCGNLKSSSEPTSTGGILTTTATYDYTTFALGRLASAQSGAKTATNFTYYQAGDPPVNGISQPVGLVKSVFSPTPGTAGTGSQVTTTYAYTALGNVASVTLPAPNSAVGTVMYKYAYTGGGKSEALGEPTSVLDPNNNTTTFHYDSRGNVTAVIDANGYETDFLYNLADQLTETIYPATTANAALRAYTIATYGYLGGPVNQSNLYNEKLAPYDASGTVFRNVTRTPGKEDETTQVSGNTPTVANTFDNLYRPHSFSYFPQAGAAKDHQPGLRQCGQCQQDQLPARRRDLRHDERQLRRRVQSQDPPRRPGPDHDLPTRQPGEPGQQRTGQALQRRQRSSELSVRRVRSRHACA